MCSGLQDLVGLVGSSWRLKTLAKATTNIRVFRIERLGAHLQENEMSLEKQALILKFEEIGGK